MTTSRSLRKGLDAGTPSLLPQELSRCSSSEARKLLNFEAAKDLCALPLGFVEQYGNTVLTLAAGKPSAALKNQLQFLTGHTVRTVEVATNVVLEAIFLAYRGTTDHLEDAAQKVTKLKIKESQGTSVGFREVKTPENDLLCSLIDYALALDASDLHFIPRKEGLFVSVRAEGELRTRDSKLCSIEVYSKMIQRIKVLSKLDITVKYHAQEGSFIVPLLHGNITARVSIIPTIYGESISLRFLNQARFLSIDELRFADSVVAILKGIVRYKNGLVIFSGSTGSGKTTSLYAVTEYLSRHANRVASIEDPVECIVPWMMQTQVHKEKGLGFENGLKALLRQDPDTILIGEIRDSQVAEVSVEAALTGHLILCSLHAGSAQETLTRFRSLIQHKAVPYDQILRMIVYQELIPAMNGSRVPIAEIAVFNDEEISIIETPALQCERFIQEGIIMPDYFEK